MAETSGGQYRRHPALVTSDRLADHYERYYDRMTGEERDALSRVRDVLERIAEQSDAR